jgi:hypothetical protein
MTNNFALKQPTFHEESPTRVGDRPAGAVTVHALCRCDEVHLNSERV